MELHELHIGEPGASAMSNCETIAGRDDWVGRVAEDLTAATGRKHRDVGNDLDGAPRNACADANALVALDDEVEDAGFLDYADPFALVHTIDERSGYLGPCLIPVCVHDAVLRVRGLATELEVAGRIEVEVSASGLQLPHTGGPFLDEHLHRLRVAERGTRSQSVATMEFWRVSSAERGGYTALRVRGCAVEERALGQE
jgi:hypothetical protein